jgi:hypothetical protein
VPVPVAVSRAQRLRELFILPSIVMYWKLDRARISRRIHHSHSDMGCSGNVTRPRRADIDHHARDGGALSAAAAAAAAAGSVYVIHSQFLKWCRDQEGSRNRLLTLIM